MLKSLAKIKTRAEREIKEAKDLKSLNEIFKKYLGKQGELTQILSLLPKLPRPKRRKIGRLANQLKNSLTLKFDERAQKLKEEAIQVAKEKEWIDITLPGKKPVVGHLHPLTLVKRKACEIFSGLGFEVVEGPDLENEWYNFDALNIPPHHPARDLWDTFWLKLDKIQKKLLLRTHTSPVQVRYMEKNQPPLRIVVPGRVFRHEATDASHEINFYQLEGLMVDKDVSVANFRAILQEFFNRFFEKEIQLRLRPSYFPFTEPSFEVDISCLNCQGKGCSACQKTGFMEMMGAGLVHPQVFKSAGLNPQIWKGFAFGMGLDRLAMMKYKINDIRLFYSGDLRFLTQF